MSSSQTKLHHVGIIVPDLNQVQLLMELLKLEPGRTQYVPQYDADCIFTQGDSGVIEFIVPRGGVLTKFNKGLGGLHQIAPKLTISISVPRKCAPRGWNSSRRSRSMRDPF